MYICPVPVVKVGKKRSFELDLNQKQPGASLSQRQQLRGKEKIELIALLRCFIEYKCTLGNKEGRRGSQ